MLGGDSAFAEDLSVLFRQARARADSLNSPCVGTEHLLEAMLQTRAARSAVCDVLLGLVGVTLPCVGPDSPLRFLHSFLLPQPPLQSSSSSNTLVLPWSASVERALEVARVFSAAQHQLVGSEHLLVGLLAAHVARSNAAGAALVRAGETSSSTPSHSNSAHQQQDLAARSLLAAVRKQLDPVDKVTIPPYTVTHLQLTCEGASHHPPRDPGGITGPVARSLDADVLRTTPAPHPDTHWLVPRRVACGRAPGIRDTATMLPALSAAGVDTLVCLQSSYTEYGCVDYRVVARCIPEDSMGRLHFYHCPVPDFGALDATSMVRLVEELVRMLERGAVLYIHCYGGHGRTGTVATCLLQALYGGGAAEALRCVARLHSARAGCRGSCALNRGELEADVQTQVAAAVQPHMERMRRLQQLQSS